MIFEAVAIGAAGLLTGAFGTKIIMSKSQFKKLEASIRTKLEKEVGDEWRVADKRQELIQDEIQLKELDLRLAETQLKATQAERDTAAAALLAEQNKADEFTAEKREIQKQELAVAAMDAESVMARERAEANKAKAQTLEAEAVATTLQLELAKIEAENLAVVKMQLEERARVDRLAIAEKNSAALVGLNSQLEQSGLHSMLVGEDELLAIYVDNASDIKGLNVLVHLKALVDIVVGLDLLIQGPYILPLVDSPGRGSKDVPRFATIQQTLENWYPTSDQRWNTFTQIRSAAKYSVVVMVHSHLDYVRWEMALLKRTGTQNPLKLLAQSAELCLPSADATELTQLFIKLMTEMLGRLNGHD